MITLLTGGARCARKIVRNSLLCAAVVFLFVFAAYPVQVTRPKITGIAFVRFKAVDLKKAKDFYSNTLKLPSGYAACRAAMNPCFVVNPGQHVELIQNVSNDGGSFLDEVGYATNDVKAMRSFLIAHQIKATPVSRGQNGLRYFETTDPEQNRIAFVEDFPERTSPAGPHQISHRLFHAGWVVKNLDREKKFYCDLLGFRLYWYGGFKDTTVDWYEIQVPDGDNWVEFMLNIPANADHAELGVQNHFSLGVPDIKAATAKLRQNGLVTNDKPEIGRDGKWSFDIYDPDGSRVEFMEPRNAQTPCCHPYTAAHPKL